MESPNKPEPPPTHGHADVWPLVIADMRERNEVGTAKYGTPLRTHNGRKPLVDLYQELLDATVYCRQAIEEGEERQRRQFAAFLDSVVYDCGVVLPEGATVEGLVGYWMDDPYETDEQRHARTERRIRDLMATLPGNAGRSLRMEHEDDRASDAGETLTFNEVIGPDGKTPEHPVNLTAAKVTHVDHSNGHVYMLGPDGHTYALRMYGPLEPG